MRMRVSAAVFLLAVSVGTPAAGAQSTAAGGGGQEMKMEMGKPVMPAGPLKITFGDKSAEWTPALLAGLPHKTVTLYN